MFVWEGAPGQIHPPGSALAQDHTYNEIKKVAPTNIYAPG